MTQDVATLHIKIFLDLVNCNIIWGQVDSKNVIDVRKDVIHKQLKIHRFFKRC